MIRPPLLAVLLRPRPSPSRCRELLDNDLPILNAYPMPGGSLSWQPQSCTPHPDVADPFRRLRGRVARRILSSLNDLLAPAVFPRQLWRNSSMVGCSLPNIVPPRLPGTMMCVPRKVKISTSGVRTTTRSSSTPTQTQTNYEPTQRPCWNHPPRQVAIGLMLSTDRVHTGGMRVWLH